MRAVGHEDTPSFIARVDADDLLMGSGTVNLVPYTLILSLCASPGLTNLFDAVNGARRKGGV